MKTLLLILLLATPLIAQTRAELDSKYGPPEGNLYRVSRSILVEATFSEKGKLRSVRILPDDSRDRNSLLKLREVVAVMHELAGSRMCHSKFLNSSRINEVPCPPRSGCYGVKEVWKSMTSLLVWYKDAVVYDVMTLSDEPKSNVPAPGGMKLLPGYENVPGCGIDTLGGYIRKVGGIEIHYDIGELAGNFARRHANENAAEWIKTEEANGDSVLIVLGKDNYIVATFQKAFANFTAKVGSQSDIDDFIKMVLTYHPRQ